MIQKPSRLIIRKIHAYSRAHNAVTSDRDWRHSAWFKSGLSQYYELKASRASSHQKPS